MSLVQMWAVPAVLWSVILGAAAFYSVREYRRNKTPIPIGSKWVLRVKASDPWPKGHKCVITVIDCKEGWVRYSMGGDIFNDERMKTASFLYCYAELPA